MGFFCLELYTILPLTGASKDVTFIKNNALLNVFKSRYPTLLKTITIYPAFRLEYPHIHAVKFLCNLKHLPLFGASYHQNVEPGYF